MNFYKRVIETLSCSSVGLAICIDEAMFLLESLVNGQVLEELSEGWGLKRKVEV